MACLTSFKLQEYRKSKKHPQSAVWQQNACCKNRQKQSHRNAQEHLDNGMRVN